jgi:threonine dehydrogenase-like Zn-dependent dehydrogenase
MQASRIVGPGQIRLVDLEPAKPGEGEVLVRPLYVALCGSDVYHLNHLPAEEYPMPVGSSGHEMVGVVEEVGPGTRHLDPGTEALVISPPHTALAERYVAKAEHVFPRPLGMPWEHLVLAQQLGTVVYAARRLPNVVGAKGVVIGQRSAGVFWAQMLRRLGCDRIIVADLLDHRAEAGKRLGADTAVCASTQDVFDAVREATDGAMADVVIEAAGDGAAINLAPRLVRPRGILYFFGVPHTRTIEFDYWSFFRAYARTFTNSGAMLEPGGACFRTAIDLICRGDVKVDGMITHRVRFPQVGEAFRLAETGAEGAHKVLMVMPGAE